MTLEIPTRSGDKFTTDDERQILDTINKWLDRDVRDNVLELEHADAYPHEMVEQMKSLGLFGASISRAYGGLGLPSSTYARIVALVSEVWMSLTGIFNSHLIMAAAVERFGTEEQKLRLLPRFASGELRGGLALTEPDCGTDLQAIRTRAIRDGDEYVINGQKTSQQDFINVFSENWEDEANSIIQFKCTTQLAAYGLRKLEVLFDELSYTNILKSKKIKSKI